MTDAEQQHAGGPCGNCWARPALAAKERLAEANDAYDQGSAMLSGAKA
ncbi:hypothetical protein [Streptomyces cellulosae]|uniref:Uncharacterized protein n=1 Tax=Streptomyces cellulosae TaxID=1968 RepID=A0ABW7YCY9_STRCE